jgi:hypothetical protein
MDDIHYNAADNRTVRNLPAISEGLKTIYCKKGMSTCELSYTIPSGALLQADGDNSAGERNFYEIAKSKGTDKVDGHQPGMHHYDTTYRKFCCCTRREFCPKLRDAAEKGKPALTTEGGVHATQFLQRAHRCVNRGL